MRFVYNVFKNHIVIGTLFAMALLASFGTQTISMSSPSPEYQASILNTDVETSTTTNTTVVETTTTISETSTTEVSVVITTTTEVYSVTTVPEIVISDVDGPPHNTTSLVGCISYWESTWGKDPNVFQFTQGTWETYGGTGSPSNASYSLQEKIFWIAWEDDGYHHWAAQKGRCF